MSTEYFILQQHNTHSYKLEALEETYKFLDTCGHSKVSQENTNQLNRCIMWNVIKAAIKSLQKRKVQDLTDFLLNSTRPVMKNYYEHSLNFFMKEKLMEYCLTHFMKPLLHSSPNQRRTHPKSRTICQSL
jgi:hypothetical protein